MSGEIRSGREHQGDLSLDADVVVVGSGAGGAVVASILAEAGVRVIVLEEGPHLPVEQYATMRPSEHIRRAWRDGAMTAAIGLGDTPMINVTMGRVVGGSSMLTGGVCFRIPDFITDRWSRDLGLEGFDAKSLERCYESVERICNVHEVPAAMRSRGTQLFWDGATKLGHSMGPIRRNTDGCNGCGRCNFGCPHGAKLSVDRSYIPRAIEAGADVWADCQVDRVQVQGDRAVGVVGRVLSGRDGKRGGKLMVRAKRVVLAAGAAHTPILLKRSGIGRASDQVGKNITLHPGFRMLARFDEAVRGWSGALQSAWSGAFEHEGITLTGLFVPPGILASTLAGVGAEQPRSYAPHLAMFGGMLHDEGGGEIRMLWGMEPMMTYRMSRKDRAAISLVIRHMGETFFAAGARTVFPPVFGMPELDADAFRRTDFASIPSSRIECASQHPLGSARMGVSPGNSVVDRDGATWDVRELFVADGSIVPTSLGVNPQLAIMTLATRIGWKLRERALA